MLKDWIAPHRTALLLVDMQVDFASPDGAMAKSGADVTAAPGGDRKAPRCWPMRHARPACHACSRG